jgi:hypothetical protein
VDTMTKTTMSEKETRSVFERAIAKIKAGDALCEAAKELGWMITVYPHVDLSKISKAIAKYEEIE